jgi:DNA-binding transcriptional MerR regulator
MAESMGALVPIGRFSTICKLTIKALRHYDDLGLLRPALTDPHSGYRYYRLDQVAVAGLIRDLRAAEMPLEAIGKVLRDPTAPDARALLTGQQQRLRERIAAQHAAIGRLDRLVAQEDYPTQEYAIELLSVPMQLLVSERLTILPTELSNAIPRAIAAIQALIARHDTYPAGMPVTLYHTAMPEGETMAIEVGWPVAAPIPVAGAIGMGTLGGVTVARTTHHGPYNEVSGAFAALTAWIHAHGHETTGAPWETYRSNPGDSDDPAALLTDVCWPIR